MNPKLLLLIAAIPAIAACTGSDLGQMATQVLEGNRAVANSATERPPAGLTPSAISKEQLRQLLYLKLPQSRQAVTSWAQNKYPKFVGADYEIYDLEDPYQPELVLHYDSGYSLQRISFRESQSQSDSPLLLVQQPDATLDLVPGKTTQKQIRDFQGFPTFALPDRDAWAAADGKSCQFITYNKNGTFKVPYVGKCPAQQHRFRRPR